MSQVNTDTDEFAHAAPLFAALGDATRLAVVNRLSVEGPQSISRLTSGSHVTRQAITKHLTILAAAGIIHGQRSGREHIWTLEVNQVAEARRYLEHVSQRWDEALARLKTFVE
jgi:DNA-binding transcriptional ArsR family regulator